MLAAITLAGLLSADDPIATPILKALAAREQTFKRAAWRYHISPPPPLADFSPHGAVQLSDSALCYTSETPERRRRLIESPTAVWQEITTPSGRLVQLSRTRPPPERRGIPFDSAELQGLAVRGVYEPLSKYLETALVEKTPTVVRFTVNETRRQRENQRRDYDFEAAPPYRLKAFRLSTDDGATEEFFENREFGVVAGHWYVRNAGAGTRSQADESQNSRVTIEIRDVRTNAPPIDFAKLEAALSDKNAEITDEFRPAVAPKP